MKKIRKGMILSAGLGTRLLPITKKFPKPLVPILNVPNILHNLFLFREAGVEEIILNLHHLGASIESFLGDGKKFGVRLHYSHEEVLLGTGGGVKKAESFLSEGPFLLGNCDFVTNVELKPFIGRHFERDALATMILFEDEKRQKLFSEVGLRGNGELCSLPKLKTDTPARTGIFSGVHVLDPKVLEYLSPEPSGINDKLYPKLMKEFPRRVFGDFMENSYWFDTGDLTGLWKSSMELLEKLQGDAKMLSGALEKMGGLEMGEKGIWIARGEKLPSDVRLHPPVILGKGIRWGKEITVGPFAVVGDNCSLSEGSVLSRSVLLPHVETSPRDQVVNALLTEK